MGSGGKKVSQVVAFTQKLLYETKTVTAAQTVHCISNQRLVFWAIPWGLWDLSWLPRDGTWAPNSESLYSSSPDRQALSYNHPERHLQSHISQLLV